MSGLVRYKVASSPCPHPTLKMATSPPNVNRQDLENCTIIKQFSVLQTPFIWEKKMGSE